MMDGYIYGDFEGTRYFAARLSTIKNYVGPLMMAWAKVLVEDNRRGVLAGVDGNDQPVKPTSYRQSFTQAGIDKPTYVKSVFNVQTNASWRVNVSGTQSGSGYKPGPLANLTTREYKKQSGPPLAPRGMASRIISNYAIEAVQNENILGVEGRWYEVVDKKGRSFLPYHFNGGKHLPMRNMVGLRRWGKQRARRDLREWINDLMTDAQAAYFTLAGHNPEFVATRRGRRV